MWTTSDRMCTEPFAMWFTQECIATPHTDTTHIYTRCDTRDDVNIHRKRRTQVRFSKHVHTYTILESRKAGNKTRKIWRKDIKFYYLPNNIHRHPHLHTHTNTHSVYIVQIQHIQAQLDIYYRIRTNCYTNRSVGE